MKGSSLSTRAELVHGTVLGLGVSSALWAAVYTPGLAEPVVIAGVLLGGLVGAARLPCGRLGELSLRYPIQALAWLNFGIGASVLIAVLAAGTRAIGRRRSPEPERDGPAVELATAALAAAAAALIADLAGARLAAEGATILLFLALHAVVDGGVRAGVERLRSALTSDDAVGRPRPDLGLLVLRGIVAWLTAGFLVGVWNESSLRPWLIGPVVVALLIVAGRTAHRFLSSPGSSTTERETRRVLDRILARASAGRDSEARGHLRRVQWLSVAVAERLEMDRERIDALSSAALLHEIGRLRSLPGESTRALGSPEMAVAGAELLIRLRDSDRIAATVRHRYERWNGEGGPDGLRGETIPPGARILAVVDSYDHRLAELGGDSERARNEALLELQRDAGATFDNRVVRALIEHLEEGPRALPEATPTPIAAEPADRSVSARRELDALYEIGRAVGRSLDLDENLALILHKLAELVPYRTAAVYLAEGAGSRVVCRFAYGAAAERVRGTVIERGTGLSSVVTDSCRARSMVRVGGASIRADLPWELDRLQPDPELTSLTTAMSAPLVVGGRGIGALTLYQDRSFPLDSMARRALAVAAGHVAEAVRRADPADPGYFESLTDPLTGLPNARYLEIRVTEPMRLPRATESRYGLIALRVEDYTRVCESHGLDTADQRLGVLARRLAAACEPNEFAVRFGQDLFLVLQADGAAGDLDRRRHALSEAVGGAKVDLPPSRPGRPRLVTAEASCPRDGGHLDDLLAVLDERLESRADHERKVVPFRLSQQVG